MKRLIITSVFSLISLSGLFAQETTPASDPTTPNDVPATEAEKPKKEVDPQEAKARDLLQNVADREKVKKAEEQKIVESNFEQGKRLFDRGMYEQSIQYFQNALRVDPDHKESKSFLSRAEANIGTRVNKIGVEAETLKDMDAVRKGERLAEIRNSIEKAKGYQEESAILGKQQRGDLSREEKLDQMIKLLNQALEQYRKTLEMLQWVDVSEETLKDFTALVKKEMRNIDITKVSISSNLDEEKKRLAIEYEQRQTNLDAKLEKERLQSLIASANDAFDRGSYQQCEKICRQITKIDPTNKEAIRLRSKARSKMQSKNKKYITQNYEEEHKRWIEKNTLDMIPWNNYITYSEDWDWISQRSAVKNSKVREAAWQTRYRGILDQKASFDWEQQPLADVINDIRALFPDLQIILQKSALDRAGVTDQDPVDLKVRDLPLKNILRLLLANFNLSYGLVDQALVIANESGVQGELTLERYDVRDLTVTINDFPGPDVSLANSTGIGAEPGIVMPTEPSSQPVTAEQIAELIKNKLNKATWDGERGTSIVTNDGQLLVTQTYEMHLMIEDFLTRLRRTRATQVAVNVRVIRSNSNQFENIGVNWQGLDQAEVSDNRGNLSGGAGFLSDVTKLDSVDMRAGVFTGTPQSNATGGNGLLGQFAILGNTQYEAVLAALESTSVINTLTAPRLLVYNNQLAFIAVIEQQSYISDFNVSDGIFDPTIASFFAGIVLEVRPTISSNRKYITLQLSPTIRDLDSLQPLPLVSAANAGLDLQAQQPAVSTVAVQTTVAIPDRGVMVIGGLSKVAKTKLTSGVPILSKIPLLGRLFRRDTTEMDRKNILLLVNAEIILLEEIESNL